LVLVLYKHAKIDLLAFHVVMKARDNLLECVVQDPLFGPYVGGFLLSIRKDYSILPSTDRISSGPQNGDTLRVGQMDISFCFLEVLAECIGR